MVVFKNVEAIEQTPKALLCKIGDESVWVPDSQILPESEVYRKGDIGKLAITEWWAEKKGLLKTKTKTSWRSK